ncbi:hypothetical protein TNCV_2414461 [Trichonephila clavipes]|nr:hypothetical protein TNCV_2414461 [Trichonephila clavipes]
MSKYRGSRTAREDFIKESKIVLDFDRKSFAIQDSQIEDTTDDEGNLRIDHSKTKLNVAADVASRNLVENIAGENVACAVIRDLCVTFVSGAINRGAKKGPRVKSYIDALSTLRIARLRRQSVKTGLATFN